MVLSRWNPNSNLPSWAESHTLHSAGNLCLSIWATLRSSSCQQNVQSSRCPCKCGSCKVDKKKCRKKVLHCKLENTNKYVLECASIGLRCRVSFISCNRFNESFELDKMQHWRLLPKVWVYLTGVLTTSWHHWIPDSLVKQRVLAKWHNRTQTALQLNQSQLVTLLNLRGVREESKQRGESSAGSLYYKSSH